MVFSSTLFIFGFLPIALGVYFGISQLTNWNRIASCCILTILSLAFYYWGSGEYLIILCAAILFNQYISKYLVGGRNKTLLLLGIAVNLSFLVYFKYAKFLIDNFNVLAGTNFATNFHPYLPVGISFFTFMSIAYLVDVSRNVQKPTTLLNYGTYLSLFPHLVAGPIVRYSEIERDIDKLSKPKLNDFYCGIIRFCQGLGMKVLLADNLSEIADIIFHLDPRSRSFSDAWLGALCYTYQIYFDFAGYSAMAIGLALMFGFHFPENFNQPYRSRSVTEFWRRWHITLSSFLRDYIYIPLGGSYEGKLRTFVNLIIVFFICGLWHGASWTFIVWGLYQGLLLIIERLLKTYFDIKVDPFFGVVFTFLLTSLGWVFFRSDSIQHAWQFIQAMLQMPSYAQLIFSDKVFMHINSLFVTTLLAATFFSFFSFEFWNLKLKNGCRIFNIINVFSAFIIFIISISYGIIGSYKPFIYFRF